MVTKKNCCASSKRWLKEHFSDKYVQQAQQQALRSRSWFKLNAIQQSEKILHLGMNVVDLGAAPGGWSKYAITQIGSRGSVIACDILPMNPLVGVDFLQGDFTKTSIMNAILKRIKIKKKKIQAVLSDMSPNISGISEIDIPKSMCLAALALDMCRGALAPGGSFLVKVLQGDGFNSYLHEVRSLFKKVKICKPDASRSRSREVYIVATGHKIKYPELIC